MSEFRDPWIAWREDLSRLLRKRGFDSLVEFLKANEGITYRELAGRLAGQMGQIPPIQIISAAYEEGRNTQNTRYVAIDGLVRNIVEKCKLGWRCGENDHWIHIQAVSSWGSEVVNTGGNTHLRERVDLMASQLLDDETIEDTWVPSDTNDTRLTQLFDEFWPEND